jgi:hypothetical protein
MNQFPPSQWQMKKIFNQKILIIFLGHLWTPVANLPSVSTTLVKLVAKFAAGVVDTGGAP